MTTIFNQGLPARRTGRRSRPALGAEAQIDKGHIKGAVRGFGLGVRGIGNGDDAVAFAPPDTSPESCEC